MRQEKLIGHAQQTLLSQPKRHISSTATAYESSARRLFSRAFAACFLRSITPCFPFAVAFGFAPVGTIPSWSGSITAPLLTVTRSWMLPRYARPATTSRTIGTDTSRSHSSRDLNGKGTAARVSAAALLDLLADRCSCLLCLSARPLIALALASSISPALPLQTHFYASSSVRRPRPMTPTPVTP